MSRVRGILALVAVGAIGCTEDVETEGEVCDQSGTEGQPDDDEWGAAYQRGPIASIPESAWFEIGPHEVTKVAENAPDDVAGLLWATEEGRILVKFLPRDVYAEDRGGKVDIETHDDDFRAIIGGEDDRFPVTSEGELTSWPTRSVGRVRAIPDWNAGADRGTGTMVGPRHVLTAAHVLSELAVGAVDVDNDGEPDDIWVFAHKVNFGDLELLTRFLPGAWNQDLEGPNGVSRVGVSSLFLLEHFANPTNSNFDVALLILEDREETAALGWWSMCAASVEFVETYDEFYTLGFPGSTQQCEHTPDDDGECGGWMYEMGPCSGNDAAESNKTFFAGCDSQAGQSGQAIYVDCGRGTPPCIVGVLASGSDENRYVRLGQSHVEYFWEDGICQFSNRSQFEPPGFCD